jgi:rhamnogalacturonan endolyase
MTLGGAIDTLGLTGYVNNAGRGRVIINGISGLDNNYTYLVTLTNAAAQYWTTATPGSGAAGCYGVKAGTYTLNIYKGQLVVDTITGVVVPAGGSTTYHTITITDDPSTVPTIWRIGNWDGTPLEFLNGPLIYQMHPSDVRMSKWEPITFTVGSTPTSSFPAIQFRGTNSPTTINFTLTAAQAAAAHTLKIGITDAYASGRPGVTINGNGLSIPGASGQPNSRSFTTGSFRGNNTTFTWSIPAADFKTGQNTLVIAPVSGSSDLGAWLSASYAFDCVELDN